MIFEKRGSTKTNPELEAELVETLRDFRSGVHAWSDAEFARPRTIVFAEHRRTWRRATAWALGCVLAVGGLSAGVYEHQHHDRLARSAAAQRQAAERLAKQELAAQHTAEQTRLQDEKLMAAVDRDVSQEVPSAMEPLAELMDNGGK